MHSSRPVEAGKVEDEDRAGEGERERTVYAHGLQCTREDMERGVVGGCAAAAVTCHPLTSRGSDLAACSVRSASGPGGVLLGESCGHKQKGLYIGARDVA